VISICFRSRPSASGWIGGRARALVAGQRWHRDEKLKTVGRNNTVTLTYGDGSQVEFAGNTLAVLKSSRQGHPSSGLIAGTRCSTSMERISLVAEYQGKQDDDERRPHAEYRQVGGLPPLKRGKRTPSAQKLSVEPRRPGETDEQ
jgi:hypothetical protein